MSPHGPRESTLSESSTLTPWPAWAFGPNPLDTSAREEELTEGDESRISIGYYSPLSKLRPFRSRWHPSYPSSASASKFENLAPSVLRTGPS